MKKLDKNLGITLITLVVTIVVLLILAGVSVAMLTGENGILTQANNAKEMTQSSNAEEIMKIVIAEIRAENSELSVKKIKSTLSKYNGSVEKDSNGNFPICCKINDMKFIVASDGKITKLGEILDISTENEVVNSKINFSWDELKQIANTISFDDKITASTSSVTVKLNNKTEKVSIGNYAIVKYKDIDKKVRIIGFNQDIKKDGGTAGITFDFETLLDKSSMNKENTNNGGWGQSKLREQMNNYLSEIQLDESIRLTDIVEEVKKDYIAIYNKADSVVTDNYDKLWLLAASEIFEVNSDGTYAFAKTSEGKQYKYYYVATQNMDFKTQNTQIIKHTSNENNAGWWWLRSPGIHDNNIFLCIFTNGVGNVNHFAIDSTGGIAPGFCI